MTETALPKLLHYVIIAVEYHRYDFYTVVYKSLVLRHLLAFERRRKYFELLRYVNISIIRTAICVCMTKYRPRRFAGWYGKRRMLSAETYMTSLTEFVPLGVVTRLILDSIERFSRNTRKVFEELRTD